MMLHYVLLIAILCINGSLGADPEPSKTCMLKTVDIPNEWLDMVKPCIKIVKSQVDVEVKAAMTYLAMGAHFAGYKINRPGFSKFFFDAASEEREHAIKIIEYLLMRGQLTGDTKKLLQFPLKPHRQSWTSEFDSLKNALQLETNVTKGIRNINIICEKHEAFNDFHLVDYFTGEFLDEQYKSERDLAGKISTLGKMVATHGTFGGFLFDKKLLNGEV